MTEKEPRTEPLVQVVIMLLIGLMAAAPAFTHVHDWTVRNGQSNWMGWANAVALELMSVAAGLEIRRRRRLHQPVVFSGFVLGAAVTVSLFAQVSEAQPGLPAWSGAGWLVAALPALAFLAVVKIVIGRSVGHSRSTQPKHTVSEFRTSVSTTAKNQTPMTGSEPERVPEQVPVFKQLTDSQPGRDSKPIGPERGEAKRRMRAHWDHHRATGTVPSSAELAKVGGLSDTSYARRLIREWTSEQSLNGYKS